MENEENTDGRRAKTTESGSAGGSANSMAASTRRKRTDSNGHAPDPARWPRNLNIFSPKYLSLERLSATLPSYYAELRQFEQCKQSKDAACWLGAAFDLLGQAEEALIRRDPDGGWRCLNAARRLELRARSEIDRAYFLVEARAVLEESKDKLDSWRRAAVVKSLANDDADLSFNEDVDVASVLASAQILHEHHDNTYQKARAIWRQFFILVPTAAIALAVFILWLAPSLGSGLNLESPPAESLPAPAGAVDTSAAAAGDTTGLFLPEATAAANDVVQTAADADTTTGLGSISSGSDVMSPSNPILLVAVALFGVMGACLSGISTLAASAMQGRIPNRLISEWTTITRPIVGGVAAVVAYYFLVAGLLGAISITQADVPWPMLAFAFVAGFSEKLVWRAAEKVGKG